MDTYNEKEIIALLQDPKRQREAFECIVKQYSEQLYWQIRRMVLSHDDANDLLQNTFIKAWINIDYFRAEAKMSTWLYRIASNKVIDWLRSSRSASATVSLEELDCEVSDGCDEMGELSELAANSARAARIGELLCTYPDDVQRIVRLRVYAERPFGEIAEVATAWCCIAFRRQMRCDLKTR